MKSQSKHWLDSAKDDLLVVHEIIGNEHLTHMAAFHCQQAIEKSLKAVLEEKEGNVPRIHNIINLKGLVEKHTDLYIDEKWLVQINELYTDARYPTDLGLLPDGKPTADIAKRFFETAEKVQQAVRAYLLS